MSKSLKTFIKDMVERVIVTFAEALLGAISVYSCLGEIQWKKALGIAGFSALISFLKCIIARQIKDEKSASLIK